MKIHVIKKTIYNGAYGTVEGEVLLKAYRDKEIAEKRVAELEKEPYTKPTYFSIVEVEYVY